MAPTHYETLGAAEGASPAEVRRAYLARARSYHPDRFVDAGVRERARAQRNMQEVNEAWRVLGDPAERRRYDRELAVERAGARSMTTSPASGDEPTSYPIDDPGPVDLPSQVIRGLPWVLLLGVLAVIFVFTAYATSNDSASDGPSSGCVVVLSGPIAEEQPCDVAGARRVRAEVDGANPCPPGTERLQAIDRMQALCLEVGGAP